LAVSIVSGATLAPWFLVGPFAGALVDRYPRRAVMIVADVARAASLAVLVALIVSGHASIAALAVAGFLLTSGQSFHNAAAQALIPQLAGRDRTVLAGANSRIATTEAVAGGFVGPPVGSVLFAAGPWVPIAADAVSFAASAALIRAIPRTDEAAREREGIFASIGQALRWMVRRRQLLELALLIGGGNLATNAALATFVLFAHQRLGLAAAGYGLLLAAQALGATAGGWIAGRMSRRLTFRAMLPIAQAARAVALLVLAVSRSPWVGGACMAVIGASFTVGTVAAVSARQQLVPDYMLGRIVSVFRLIGNGAAPIGAIIGGIIASRFSLPTPIVVGGAGTLVVAGLSLLPQFRSAADSDSSGEPMPATTTPNQR
jgi:MFS family permease